MKRIAYARIAQETNALSPVDTTLHDFDGSRELGHTRGPGAAQRLMRGEHQRRAQPLPFTEEAVPDNLVPTPGPHLEDRVHPGAGITQVRSEPAASGRSLHP